MFHFVHHVHYVVQNRDEMVEYLDKTFGMKPTDLHLSVLHQLTHSGEGGPHENPPCRMLKSTRFFARPDYGRGVNGPRPACQASGRRAASGDDDAQAGQGP